MNCRASDASGPSIFVFVAREAANARYGRSSMAAIAFTELHIPAERPMDGPGIPGPQGSRAKHAGLFDVSFRVTVGPL